MPAQLGPCANHLPPTLTLDIHHCMHRQHLDIKNTAVGRPTRKCGLLYDPSLNAPSSVPQTPRGVPVEPEV